MKRLKSTTRIIAFLLIFMVGCTTINQDSGMTEWDYKSMNDGRILTCTEENDGKCIIQQWLTTEQYFAWVEGGNYGKDDREERPSNNIL